MKSSSPAGVITCSCIRYSGGQVSREHEAVREPRGLDWSDVTFETARARCHSCPGGLDLTGTQVVKPETVPAGWTLENSKTARHRDTVYVKLLFLFLFPFLFIFFSQSRLERPGARTGDISGDPSTDGAKSGRGSRME